MTLPSTAPDSPQESGGAEHPLLPLWRALGEIPDPCQQACGYELSIVDLGIVNGVVAEDGCVSVSLTFTEPTCTFGFRIIQEIEDRLAQIPGVRRARVSIDPFPLWEPSRLTERARRAHAESRLRFGLPTAAIAGAEVAAEQRARPKAQAGSPVEIPVSLSRITMGGHHD
jgi:metal-sulfur cluster biosynthetic enzyme